MSLTSITAAEAKSMIGTEVTFSTYNTYDNRVIVGKVDGVVTAVVAKTITDVVNYNEQVIKGHSTDPTDNDYYAGTDVDVLTYVLIRTGTVDSGVIEAYAVDWIGSWSTTAASKGNVDIRLINVDAQDVADALAGLANLGFSGKVI